ncbi:hypothetical protein K502DRAFT_364544 [Neoconidiobolus thromboides FSU 785]|nr:hypothetical protein K502DRAFT_364544 [Neoconidiobolus thromboides FSU 785]
MQGVFSLESRKRYRRVNSALNNNNESDAYQGSPLNPNFNKGNTNIWSLNNNISTPPISNIRTRSEAIINTDLSLPRMEREVSFGSRSSYEVRLKQGDTSLLVPLSTTYQRMLQEYSYFPDQVKDMMDKSRTISKNKMCSRILKLKKEKVGEDLDGDERMCDSLIPIRIDLDLGDYFLKDVFLWNENETQITALKFAEILCIDLNLENSNLINIIENNIKSQVEKYDFIMNEIQKNQTLFLEYENEIDIILLIKLDLMIGNYHYQDEFNWNLDSEISPENFADILAADLGIGGEFKVMIAHSIREQLFQFMEQKVEAITYLERKSKKEGYRNEMDNLLQAALSTNSYIQTIEKLKENTNNKNESIDNVMNINVKNDKNNLFKDSIQLNPTLPKLIKLLPNLMEKQLGLEEVKSKNIRRRRDTTRRIPNKRIQLNNSPSTGSPYVFD